MLKVSSFYGDWTSFPEACQEKRWMSKTHLVLTRNIRHLKGELSSLALQEASVQKTCEESVQCTKQMGIQTWKSLEDSNKCNFYRYRRTSWSIQCCCTVTWAERKDDGLDKHCLGILLLSLNCGLVFCKVLKYRSSSSGCYQDTKMTNTCAGLLFVGSDISQPMWGGRGLSGCFERQRNNPYLPYHQLSWP